MALNRQNYYTYSFLDEDDNILVKDWQIMAQFPKNKHKKPTIIEINVE